MDLTGLGQKEGRARERERDVGRVGRSQRGSRPLALTAPRSCIMKRLGASRRLDMSRCVWGDPVNFTLEWFLKENWAQDMI